MTASDHAVLRNLPNALTVLRLCAVPVFCAMVVASDGPTLAAGIVFIAASLTDFADGQIARRAHITTRFGTMVDPLADRLLVSSAAVLASIYDPRMPAWAFLVVVWRDVLAVYGYLRARSRVLPTISFTGKAATLLLMASLSALLVLPDARWPMVPFWVGAVLSIVALGQYVTRYRWVLAEPVDGAATDSTADPQVDVYSDG